MMQNYTDEELSHAILKAVDAINMKKAVKAEPCFTLTEILVNKKLTALRNLAKIYKVRGYTGMDKKALAQSLVAKINDERVLEAHLMLLDELEWNLFRRAVEVQYLIPDKLFIDSYRMMLDLGIMELYYHDEKFHCIVSEEIKETYAKLQRIGLAEEKDHAVLLNNYAAAAVHLYGVISQDDFVDLFNSQNDRKINTDEVFSILIKYVSMEYGYAFWDEYIVSDYLEQNAYKDVANYVKAASRFPRYVPDKDDLLKYADGSYFDETKHTAKLREYINTHLSGDAYITDEIVEEIVYLSFTDTKFQNIFNIFDKHGIEFKSQGQAEQFMAVLVEAYNSSRKWSNNGHTPAEVQGIYKVNPIKPLKGQEEKFTFAIKKEEPIISQPKVGRNEPCPCGSGKKYKKCCSA